MNSDDLGNIRFERYTMKNGLTNNLVQAITQDRMGFLWIGTQDGLNRFDGNSFKVYNNDPDKKNRLPKNDVQSLLEDSSGNIWIGTAGMGLVYYIPETDKIVNPSFFEVDSNSIVISSFAEDSNGNIWAGSYGRGLFRMKKNHNGRFQIERYDSSFISSLEIIPGLTYDHAENNLYVSTWRSGLIVIELANGRARSYMNDTSVDSSISDDRVKKTFIDSDRNFWILTHNGLNRFDSDNKFERFLHDPEDDTSISSNIVSGMAEDDQGFLWVSCRTEGLNCLSKVKHGFVRFDCRKNSEHDLSSNSILCMFKDSGNVIWIGTHSEGLCKIDRNLKPFLNILKEDDREGTNNANKIRSMARIEDGTVALGTISDGLYFSRIEGNKLISEKSKDLQSKAVYVILPDKDILWISSHLLGLCKYDRNIEQMEVISDPQFDFIDSDIYAMINDSRSKNILWLGTRVNGLLAFDKDSMKFLNGSLLPKEVKDICIYSLLQDSEGFIWIGTQNKGILKFDPSRSRVLFSLQSSVSDRNTLSSNTIFSIAEDLNGFIWIGTSDRGLNNLTKDGKVIARYADKEGLENNSIYSILFDETGRPWVATNKTISCLETDTGTFRNYSERDGILNSEFNFNPAFSDDEGHFYVGGMDGITKFDPKKIKLNEQVPNVVITDIQVFNRSVEPSDENPYIKKNIAYADELNLTYKESVFSFEFASLIFNNPQKNQYAYKMEGFDKDWTYCGKRRRVTYTNLDAGTYNFRVKGSNNDGVWNEEGASLRLTISPPYWQTWWFRSLGALAMMAATGLSYRQRLAKIEKEKKDQEDFSKRLIDSQESDRKRIASELHHTIAHDILIARNKALMALRHKQKEGVLEEALKEIADLASSTMNDVRSISYNLHPHQLENVGFTKTLKSMVAEVANSTEIKFRCNLQNSDKLLSKEDELNLFRALQESISNVLKHSEATEANLTLRNDEGYLYIVLADNGIGFDPKISPDSDRMHGLGIKSISERIKFMKGEYKIETAPGRGTTVFYKIPISKNHEAEIKDQSTSGG